MNLQLSACWVVLTLSAVSFFNVGCQAAADANELVSRTTSWQQLDHGLQKIAGSFVENARKLDGVEARQCPVDLSDLSDVQFAITDTCMKSPPSAANNTWPPGARDSCCNIVQTAYAILQAVWTQDSHYFRVENETVLRSCVSEFVQRINGFGTGLDVGLCFSDSFFKYSNRDPSLCGPITTQDYEAALPKSTIDGVRSSCIGNLLDKQACSVCSSQANQMFVQMAQLAVANNITLNSPDGNVTDLASAKSYDCIYDTVTYLSAVLLHEPPTDPGTQLCLYIMPLPPLREESRNVGLIVGLTLAAAFVLLLVASGILLYLIKKKGLKCRHLFPGNNRKVAKLGTLSYSQPGVVIFDYAEMKTVTKNFSNANHIGSGGFGSVYKGVMPDGTIVAVKKLKNASSEGDSEFVNEVEVINRVRHRNLVRLRGCCVGADEGQQRLLVYDFLPGGSLNDHLFGSSAKSGHLTWPQRSRIAVDIARGLAYLHHDTSPPIFHRDIKASNVLLDNDYNACLADFGLAKLTLEGQSHMTASTVAGTHGYMAPEYAMYGKLTGKSDVYSFGVLLLEIMSGRKALDTSLIATPRFLISDWCWTVVESEGSVKSVIDERIRENTNPQELAVQERFVITGMLCSHCHDGMRPTMAEALKFLEGDLPVPNLPSTPAPLYAESSTFRKQLVDSTTGSSGPVTGSFSAVTSIRAEPR
ncbi:hypothetical protein R1flu_004116 [Riccia fluitans]|uniref:non-specific serine/threonine protein kinase n=1 Tax=Riccia fluitans TaxID=41844 RepID=A0ABD1YSE2_9MARC